MAFKLAQTFYIDKSSVRDSEHVTLTSIDLFFKKKPLETANRSGIRAPGVSLYMMETRDDDVPDTSKPLSTGIARQEYASIVPSSDATIPITFTFNKPLVVQTNKSYAICVSYDGDEDYELWTCREGEFVVGTNTTTSGSTARNVGNYYEYSSSAEAGYDPSQAGIWKSLRNVDLKFTVKAGIYADDPTTVDIVSSYLMPSDPAEYIAYDRYHFRTSNRSDIKVGDLVFQDTPVQYGLIDVKSDSLSIKSNGINFTNMLAPTANTDAGSPNDTPSISQKSYIVLRSGPTINIREVVNITSNTEIIVDRLPTFSNNAANFSVTAVGKVTYQDLHWYTGRWWNGASMNQLVGRKLDLLRLSDTNANSSVRFSNNYVQQITINAGGSGYSNSDTVIVSPVLSSATADPANINYIPSYANAFAYVVTNNVGAIVGFNYNSAGFGLTSTINTTINTSTGSGANLFVEIGSMLRSESGSITFGNTAVMNIDVHRNYPHCHILSNQHHTYRMFQHYPYYTMPGTEHILRVSSPAMRREIDTFTNNDTIDLQSNDGRVYVLASRSNEVQTAGNVVIQTSNGAQIDTSVQCSSLVEIAITSNNAYSLPMVITDDVYNYKYIINNNTDGEIKGQGKSLARHLSTKITFAENRQAEDIVVYLDAFRPAGTDIAVYARLFNKADPDAFDDKDWTKLVLKSNNALSYSSITNDKDVIEYTFGLGTPQSVNTVAGDVTTVISSANIVGLGTNFVADLKVNDVVKIYSALFPQNYFISVVTNVANTSQITIADPIANNSYAGSGFKIDFIGRPAVGTATEIGYPFQAFINQDNDSVCRYYSSSMAKFDTYNTFQIKTVLTSNNSSIVPKIENIRAVGVSA